MFRDLVADVAALVKKYRGSSGGEHGTGREALRPVEIFHVTLRFSL
jgi:hypothetical protein